MVGTFVRFSKLYHAVYGSILAYPTVRHFLFSKAKMANSRQIPGRRGREGMRGHAWNCLGHNRIDSKAIKLQVITGGVIILWRVDRRGGRWNGENL